MGDLLHRKEAASYLRVSVRTLDKHIAKGLPWIDLGFGSIRHRRAFARNDLDAFVEGRKRKAAQQFEGGLK